MHKTVAVIDVGSNSIKLLVARKAADGALVALEVMALETRISRGIGGSEPSLSEEGMLSGIQSINDLIKAAAVHSPSLFDIVATSAVRGASNGAEFMGRVRKSCGLPLRILTGEEEARLIGLGLACDPTLSNQDNFFLFDLGGGSMECLSFVNRLPLQAISLPLGCVRLTEKFVTDPSAPVSETESKSLTRHVLRLCTESGFKFRNPDSHAVFTGGSMTTARIILAAGISLTESDPLIPVSSLRKLAARVCSLPLSERIRAIPGLSPSRADVFPAALLTMLAVADAGGFEAFLHSFHNLRYGLAAELLQKKASG